MYTQAQFQQTRKEIRYLRIQNAGLKRWHLSQKDRADRLEEEKAELKREIVRYKKQVEIYRKQSEKLQEKLKDVEHQRDTYQGMIFKANKRLGSPSPSTEKRNRGGQLGHPGHGRKKPAQIDATVDVFLTHCPYCHGPVEHATATTSHTVTDLPPRLETTAATTEYVIERQWCGHCKRAVQAVPQGVIPGSRLGSVLLTTVMIWKYRMRIPLAKIVELLDSQYDLKVSTGAIQGFLENAHHFLGSRYDTLKKKMRDSPVKHADETGWRVAGNNWWCWLFATDTTRVFTIEETRGKGIPQEELKGARGVLVRDDYGVYQKLPLTQQSCWTHLLRKSHEASIQDTASPEVEMLHTKLKDLFGLLSDDIMQPFDLAQRREWHTWYTTDIEKISNTPSLAGDAQKIQVRLKHQGTNLLTALLHPNVPLTNNLAERAIRPMVVTRKISGGSKTAYGATIHAINMSVVESIALEKQPLWDTLRTTLLEGAENARHCKQNAQSLTKTM